MAEISTKNIETIGYVVHGPKQDFKLENIVLDEMQDDELLIDMKYSGICHTDIVFQKGEIQICPYPAVFGHEGAGTIRAIGPKVKNTSLAVGDFVLLSINYCETCRFCRTGHPANCTEGTRLHLHGTRPDGSTAARLKDSGESVRCHFFGQSSFAKTTFVQETCVVKHPYPGGEAGMFAPMGCGYQTGAGTVMNVLKPEPESSIVVFGLGTVGLTALMAAKYMKVKQIIAVDIQASKLPLAQELGATDLVNVREVPDVVAEIKRLTNNIGADYAIDCTGVPAVIEQALNCTGMFGKTATVGVAPTGAKVNIDPLQWLLYSKTYVGVREGDSVPSEYVPKLVEMQRAGDFPVDKIVKMYDYKDFGQALHDLEEGKVVKPVIQWS
ncbi:uncharacterized protein LTR77_008353 [Saxophila tyrrhenica]|uniref:Enoyl reductase (ER) domain-containing protein n=1 Tax=Saxophila tyrrhenica TaxID=1690608 RepID=A0AAV9P3M0_9PEZI|nr:hypothetical protein LTR77_008353 [Saxophila tyrrhenica]